MNKLIDRTIKLVVAVSLCTLTALPAGAHQAAVDEHAELIPIPAYETPEGGASAAAALVAMEQFLGAFSDRVRGVMSFDFAAESRAEWSNLPARMVPRHGLSIGDMSDQQRALFFSFLSAALGPDGYKAVSDVLAAEAFLVSNDGPRSTWLQIAPENHYFSVYGTPATQGRWGWQLTGHHLALNVSYENGTLTSISPSFVGAEPAVFTVNGNSYHSNEGMHRAGFAVYSALTEEQKKKATLISPPHRLIVGAGGDGRITPQVGISGAEMNEEQRGLLLETVRQWVAIQPDGSAADRMAKIEADIDKLSYAWIGTDELNTSAYLRIQGPSLIIEMLSMVSNMGDGYGHYHTMYRNPTLEYGIEDD